MIVSDIIETTHTNEDFVFVQGTPSDTWIISHNMDCYPSVTVIDSGSNQVEGAVHYYSLNKIIITFTSGFSGRAILR